MNKFIVLCIVDVVCLVFATVLLFRYFFSKYNHFGWRSPECLAYAGLLIILSVVTTGLFLSQNTQCPNPKCQEWVESVYCQNCGWEVNPAVNCPQCEKAFDPDTAPTFCPDCGTKVKE